MLKLIPVKQNKNVILLDASFSEREQLPRKFSVTFKEMADSNKKSVQVLYNDEQAGDIITDNSYQNDFYRYHDIFHYTFATLLGWSPCARALLKRKRKSDKLVDEVEDGSKAIMTEEAVSLIIFSDAKKKNFYANDEPVSKQILQIIRDVTEYFEVNQRTQRDWQEVIHKAYAVFRLLIKNGGGTVKFNMNTREVEYFYIN